VAKTYARMTVAVKMNDETIDALTGFSLGRSFIREMSADRPIMMNKGIARAH
jgi:hypothetical protein